MAIDCHWLVSVRPFLVYRFPFISPFEFAVCLLKKLMRLLLIVTSRNPGEHDEAKHFFAASLEIMEA